MEYRRLHVTVISAEGIKDVKLFSKMDVYADVSIAGYPQSKRKTSVDKNCGTKPKWNQRMEFVVDEPYLTKPGMSLLFELMAEGTLSSDKVIGSVTVPIHELYQSAGEDRVVEYQVITTSGKPKGSIKFSYRFGEKFTQEVNHAAKNLAEEPVTAYPAAAAPYAAGGGYHAAPYPPTGGYAAAPYPGAGYPPHYPPTAGHASYPQPSGYGYQPPPPGYGYPPAAYAQKPKKNKMGGGLGLGLGAGLLGGLLVGEMASDIGETAAYADGYDDAMGDMGGFDF
jgi:hypothetical protein